MVSAIKPPGTPGLGPHSAHAAFEIDGRSDARPRRPALMLSNEPSRRGEAVENAARDEAEAELRRSAST